jgi:DNA-directed RNA polymerase specialized sigma54-like protein
MLRNLSGSLVIPSSGISTRTVISTPLMNPQREAPIALEEIADSGAHALEDVQAALEVGAGVRSTRRRGLAIYANASCCNCTFSARTTAIRWISFRDHLEQGAGPAIQGDRQRRWGLQLEEIMEAIEIVKALDPRPGQKYNREPAPTIEPDVYIVKSVENTELLQTKMKFPQLRG